MRYNLSLFLSSSIVERAIVNLLVIGSNPTWGDLIHSKLIYIYIYIYANTCMDLSYPNLILSSNNPI